MAEFRETVLSMCWVLPTLGSMYFWVMILSSFLAPRSIHSSASPSPSPAPSSCEPEHLKNTMETWVCWMALLMISSAFIMYHVREIVETAAAAEAKGSSLEDEMYKAARDELKEAIKAVEDALADQSTSASRDEYVKAIGRRNVASEKAARAKPKGGLARLTIGRQKRVRFFFFVAILFSAVAFYLFLRLQVGCVDGPAQIGPFVLVGLICLSVHMQAAWVAFTKD